MIKRKRRPIRSTGTKLVAKKRVVQTVVRKGRIVKKGLAGPRRGLGRKTQRTQNTSYDKAYNVGFDQAYNEGYDTGYVVGLEQGQQEADKGE